MFEEQKFNQPTNYINLDDPYKPKKGKFFMFFIVAIILLGLIFFSITLFVNNDNESKNQQNGNGIIKFGKNFSTTTDDSVSQLPSSPDDPAKITGKRGDLLKAEELSFGFFYKKDETEYLDNIKKINLPLNVKTDVANYYDVTRKINIDSRIKDLNNNGFIIIDNPFVESAGDFFAIYNILSAKEAPVLITSDFLIYIYQNTFKEIFKDIEENVFYNDMWEVASDLFKIADARYKDQREKKGVINDPVLEGSRLAAAYFATLLKILEPRDNQKEEKYENEALFNPSEVLKYRFNLPSYLQEDITGFLREDVVKEVNFIVGAKVETKSPVFRYQKDYKTYKLPQDYKRSAKLTNFYLASLWMNSVFPLYYKSNDCKDCLLDKNDWIINMMAANFVAQDFERHQDIKNKWAKIYKTISYFRGLREGLTYIYYNKIYEKVFGEDELIEEVFSPNNRDLDVNIEKFQQEAAEFKFPEIEGGADANDAKNAHKIGMRMLQEQYWPNDYIFSEFLGEKVGDYTGDFTPDRYGKYSNVPISGCVEFIKEDGSFFVDRCRGIGMDIVNLIVDERITDKYFVDNADYDLYNKQFDSLTDSLSRFETYHWHNNIYWNTLDIANAYLDYETSKKLDYDKKEWLSKSINTALGAWVNLHLPHDVLRIKVRGEESGFVSGNITDFYVEPNIDLVKELISNVKMLRQMMLSLEILTENSFSLIKLSDLEIDLENIKEVIIKELNNEVLDYNDFKRINDVTERFFVKEEGERILRIDYPTTESEIFESIEGIKLLLTIFNTGNQNMLFVGPIFKYQEVKEPDFLEKYKK